MFGIAKLSPVFVCAGTRFDGSTTVSNKTSIEFLLEVELLETTQDLLLPLVVLAGNAGGTVLFMVDGLFGDLATLFFV